MGALMRARSWALLLCPVIQTVGLQFVFCFCTLIANFSKTFFLIEQGCVCHVFIAVCISVREIYPHVLFWQNNLFNNDTDKNKYACLLEWGSVKTFVLLLSMPSCPSNSHTPLFAGTGNEAQSPQEGSRIEIQIQTDILTLPHASQNLKVKHKCLELGFNHYYRVC